MDDQFLYLSYSEENYPYIFLQENGRFEGFLVEIWRFAAQLLKRDISISKYHYPSLSREEEQIYDGSLGGVLNGSIISSADGYLLTSGPYRLGSFTPNVPVFYSGGSFVEPTRQDSVESTRITFFTVFSIETIVVLIFCHLVFLSVGVATRKLRDGRLSMSIPDHLRGMAQLNCLLFEFTQVLYCLSLALVVYYHAAGFQGNNAIIEPQKAITFSDAVKELKSGKRTLLTATADTYSAVEYEFLLGRNYPSDRVIVTDGLINYLKILCDPPSGKKLMGLFFEGDRTAIASIGKKCLYNQISYTPVDGIQAGNLRELTTMNPYFYLFAKNASGKRKIMETVNQVLLKLFSREQIINTWTVRYMSSVRSLYYTIEEARQFTYAPISLDRLQVTFTVILPSAAVSISSIFIEMAWNTQVLVIFRERFSRFICDLVFPNK